MKHLKKFNEELNPSTYISAGEKLIGKGQKTRGNKLIDYGMSKANIDNQEFTFYSNGLKLVATWDFDKACFVADDKKPTNKVTLRTVTKRTTSSKLYVDTLGETLRHGSGRTYTKYIQRIVYANRPIMKGEKWPSAYVKTRQEAVRLLDFLHKIGYKGSKINDLYSEDAEGVSKQEYFDQKAARLQATLGSNPKKEKPSIFKRMGDRVSQTVNDFFY